MSDERRTAGILIEVFPAGPGQIKLVIQNLGPEKLSRDEAIVVCRYAEDLLESGEEVGLA